MLIQCTQKLLKQLNIEPSEVIQEDPLFSWHANLITVDRRKVVVFVNNKTRYTIVLHGLKAKDFKNLDRLFLKTVREVFRDECIMDEVIENYFQCAGEITFTKTGGSSYVARLNAACELVDRFYEPGVPQLYAQNFLSIQVSRYPCKTKKGEYTSPNVEMYENLKALSNTDNIFRCKAAVLKMTLVLENHDVWRRVVIPLNFTFYDLHKVIQEAFFWMDYHLHGFFVYDNRVYQFVNPNDEWLISTHPSAHREGYKPLVNLYCDDENIDIFLKQVEEGFLPRLKGIEFRHDGEVRLSEYIPRYTKFKYRYDFGDNWQIYVDVEKVIDDYDKNYPVCIDGHGNAPPEDVGGESGYEKFLETINDRNHPDHSDMVAWGEMQGYDDFDIEKVNQKIRAYFGVTY